MARRGKVNELKVDLTNYDYFLSGQSSIGKSVLSFELGKKITGNNEGSFIISIGEEPAPDHINGALYDKAKTWAELEDIKEDLIVNKKEYPHTKFVVFDSFDEFCRLAEEEVVRLHNRENPDKRTSTIKSAFGGYQAGENKALDMMLKFTGELKDAGYSRFYIGHTKEKNKKDLITDIEYTVITNSVAAKYYDSFMHKVAVACVAYMEHDMTNIETVKDAFTKGTKQVGDIIGKKRVIVFRDDDNVIDTKCYFKHIQPKIDFSTDNFIKAIEDAIKAEMEEATGKPVTDKEVEKIAKKQTAEREAQAEKVIEATATKSLLDKIIANKDMLDMVQVKAIMDEFGVAKLADENAPKEMYDKILATLG